MAEEKTAMQIYEEALIKFDNLSIDDKIAFYDNINKMYENTTYRMSASRLKWNRCIKCEERKAYMAGTGDWYVYMWKHIDGTPFYVGSGKGYRWLDHTQRSRSKEFIIETDKNDAIVYKVAMGLDMQEARDIEFCCIHNLTKSGYDLTQTIDTKD